MKNICIALVAFAITIATVYFAGYILATFWGWFIVKQFGVAAISTNTAIGVMLVKNLLTTRIYNGDKELKDTFKEVFIKAGWDEDNIPIAKAVSFFAMYGFMFLAGFIWHWFLG